MTTLFWNCSSDEEDCTKTITLLQTYVLGNQTYSYNRIQEVPCDFPESEDPIQIDPPILENFSFEVLNFSYTENSETNTSRFQFEIELNNPNDYDVVGVPILTVNVNGLETKNNYSNTASIPCNTIDANSNCILTFDQESSLDLGRINSIELVTVEYFLTN
ncbi:hypothetical protein [Ulvibacterium marinum]|uniref:hypothetical protein n=1 Tax=Ulvibacterium marinum TaxID=2419782 RepID=UPI0011C49BE3|nr:hypothetical protein [Ulvibacterium marinum]